MKKNQFKYRLKYKKGKYFQTDKIKLFKFIKAKIILVFFQNIKNINMIKMIIEYYLN